MIKIALPLTITFISTSIYATTLEPIIVEQLPLHRNLNSEELLANDYRSNVAFDLKTALSNINNVDVIDAQGSRQGNDSVNIRGLNGNRVKMTIDGIDLPESQESKFFNTTGMTFGRGNYIEPTALQSIEINKKAGENALAGSIEMHTLSADDLLQGKDFAAYVQSEYNSMNKGIMNSAGVAAANDAWRGMALATWRKGHETDNQGTNSSTGTERTKPNPQDNNTRYFLTKQEYDVNNNHSFSFTAEYLKRNQWINQLSQISQTSITDNTKDTNERVRVSINHLYQNDNPALNRIDSQIYWQTSETKNYRLRTGDAYNRYGGYRSDDASVKDRAIGLSSTWQSYFNNDNFSQNWQYGLSFDYHNYSSESISNYSDIQPFADSKRYQAKVFADVDYKISNITISPGLNINYYGTNPDKDYDQRREDIAAATNKHAFHISPKIAVNWEIKPLIQPYFQYTNGFKAPSIQQLQTSYGNDFGTISYSVVGNPNLKAETANNFELGIHGENSEFNYSVSFFNNYYKNFIDYDTIDPSLQSLLVQYVNIDKAHIYGTELSLNWKFDENWKLNALAAYSKGKTKDSDGKKDSINTITPLKVQLGLAYDREKWGINTDVVFGQRKKNKDIQTSERNFYNPTKNYFIANLNAYYQPTKGLSIYGGINNIFDKKYWNWSDISYMAPHRQYGGPGDLSINQGNAAFFTAPGRTFHIGMRYEF